MQSEENVKRNEEKTEFRAAPCGRILTIKMCPKEENHHDS